MLGYSNLNEENAHVLTFIAFVVDVSGRDNSVGMSFRTLPSSRVLPF